jgi:protein-disulfide isomerase
MTAFRDRSVRLREPEADRRKWLRAIAATGGMLAVLPSAALWAADPGDGGESRLPALAEVEAGAILGSVSAPITIVEYSSFSCAHCADFHNNIFEKLLEAYIETGKVRYIVHDFPLNALALSVAKLAWCGGQRRYFEIAAVLWQDWAQWIKQPDPLPELIQRVAALGVERTAIDACLADQALEERILRVQVRALRELAVDRTPTFVIHGEPYPGMMSFHRFQEIIDRLLE